MPLHRAIKVSVLGAERASGGAVTYVAPTVRSSYAPTSGTGAGTSLTLTKPTGTAEGDVLYAILFVCNNETVTAPSGFSLIESYTAGNSMDQYVYRKVAGGSEPADYTWSWTSNSNRIGGIVAISGADTSAPEDVTDSSFESSNGAPTSPDVTTTQGNDLILRMSGVNSLRNADIDTGYPSGTTGLFRRIINDFFGGVGIAHEVQEEAGATGTAAWTPNDLNRWGVTIAVKGVAA